MDVEKTVQFLLEQQSAFASQMGELRGVVHELAVNQVALGKAQVRFESNMNVLQNTVGEIQKQQKLTEETVRRLGERVDRLVEALEKRFTTDGSGA